MLQADAKIIAYVCWGDPLLVESFQDKSRVLTPVVPHHDAEERREALALSGLNSERPILC